MRDAWPVEGDEGLFRHEVLGMLRAAVDCPMWTGVARHLARAPDLVLIEAEGPWFPAGPPRAGGVARLESALGQLEATLLPRAVDAVSQARQARLGWRAGPPLDCWTILGVIVDADDRLWLSVHEAETDEYSRWVVRFEADDRAVEVRRAPFVDTGWGALLTGATV
ncbi:hypothetical protein [Zavarzinia sp. CC-PAN008]|uniref:hypothetical protein n=1 Tax=Zavarzinia sp. CC-PAN008 TaxID=3243332 RepID=UPI003F7487AD